MEYSRHYDFDGFCNARDLGGYAASGGVTRFGVFFRSDLSRGVTGEDRRKLSELGIAVCLDLREAWENDTMPNELQAFPEIRVVRLTMRNVQRAAARTRPSGLSAFDMEFSWGDEYIRMLEDNHPWARDCVEFLAAEEKPVLFHCFTGKDRTGILAALILGLCGVSREDIAADYSISQIYLPPVYDWMRDNLPDFALVDRSTPAFSTAAEYMLALTDHLEREYGGAAAFLHQCGAGEDALEAIRARLVKKA